MNYSETSREMDEWEKFEEIEVRSLGAGVTNIGDVTTNRGGRTWNGDVNKECKVKHRYNFWFYNPPPPPQFSPSNRHYAVLRQGYRQVKLEGNKPR